jgi:hypothetical protein
MPPRSTSKRLGAYSGDETEAGFGADRPGVGSKGSHPWPGNQTSTHEWASRSSTTQALRSPS